MFVVVLGQFDIKQNENEECITFKRTQQWNLDKWFAGSFNTFNFGCIEELLSTRDFGCSTADKINHQGKCDAIETTSTSLMDSIPLYQQLSLSFLSVTPSTNSLNFMSPPQLDSPPSHSPCQTLHHDVFSARPVMPSPCIERSVDSPPQYSVATRDYRITSSDMTSDHDSVDLSMNPLDDILPNHLDGPSTYVIPHLSVVPPPFSGSPSDSDSHHYSFASSDILSPENSMEPLRLSTKSQDDVSLHHSPASSVKALLNHGLSPSSLSLIASTNSISPHHSYDSSDMMTQIHCIALPDLASSHCSVLSPDFPMRQSDSCLSPQHVLPSPQMTSRIPASTQISSTLQLPYHLETAISPTNSNYSTYSQHVEMPNDESLVPPHCEPRQRIEPLHWYLTSLRGMSMPPPPESGASLCSTYLPDVQVAENVLQPTVCLQPSNELSLAPQQLSERLRQLLLPSAG